MQLTKVKERVDRNKNNKTSDFMKVSSLKDFLSPSWHLKLVSKTSMILTKVKNDSESGKTYFLDITDIGDITETQDNFEKI